jgi:hypothetical protein
LGDQLCGQLFIDRVDRRLRTAAVCCRVSHCGVSSRSKSYTVVFTVPTTVQGGDVDVEAPNVTTDVEPPAVDVEGGDLPDVDVRGGDLPEVEVSPAGEPAGGGG